MRSNWIVQEISERSRGDYRKKLKREGDRDRRGKHQSLVGQLPQKASRELQNMVQSLETCTEKREEAGPTVTATLLIQPGRTGSN